MDKEHLVTTWKETMVVIKSLLWRNKPAMIIIYSALVLNLCIWAGTYFLIVNSQGVLITHYNVFFGIDSIVDVTEGGDVRKLFLVPLEGLIFLLISFGISVLLIVQFNQDDNLPLDGKMINFITNKSVSFIGSRLLLMSAWSLQLILIVYLLAIMKIN